MPSLLTTTEWATRIRLSRGSVPVALDNARGGLLCASNRLLSSGARYTDQFKPCNGWLHWPERRNLAVA